MKREWVSTVTRFAILFAVCFAALAAVWPYAAPAYTRAVTAVARPVFRWIETPDLTVLDAQDDRLGVYRIVGDHRIAPVVVFDRYLLFAVVPLLALFAATPGIGMRRRAVRACFGVAALFVLHIAYLVTSIELIYAVAAGRTVDALQTTVRILWESAPIAVWVALSADAWRRVFRTSRNQTETTGSPIAGAVGAEG